MFLVHTLGHVASWLRTAVLNLANSKMRELLEFEFSALIIRDGTWILPFQFLHPNLFIEGGTESFGLWSAAGLRD